MPWETHPTVAVTGSQCLASCALARGTVAEGMMQTDDRTPALITLHHPMGTMDVLIDYSTENGRYVNHSVGLVRTARKIASGEIFAHLAQLGTSVEPIYLAAIAFCSSMFTACAGLGGGFYYSH